MSWLGMFCFLTLAGGYGPKSDYLEAILGKEISIYNSTYPNDRVVMDRKNHTIRMFNREAVRASREHLSMVALIEQRGSGVYKIRLKTDSPESGEYFLCLKEMHAIVPCTSSSSGRLEKEWHITRTVNGFKIRARGTDRCLQQKTEEGHMHGVVCNEPSPEQKFDFIEVAKDPLYRSIMGYSGDPGIFTGSTAAHVARPSGTAGAAGEEERGSAVNLAQLGSNIGELKNLFRTVKSFCDTSSREHESKYERGYRKGYVSGYKKGYRKGGLHY